MEDITNADYVHTKSVPKDFSNDVYAQSVTLLMVNIFNNCQNMHLEICDLDPAHFIRND